MNNSIVLFTFIVLPVFDSCRGSTWIRHRWIGVTYQRNMENVAKDFPHLAKSMPVEFNEPERRVDLCNNVLNFGLYTIGDEEDAHLRRVLAAINQFYMTIRKMNVTISVATTHETDAGPVTVYEIPCIDTKDFFLTISYHPVTPSFKYVRVSTKTNKDVSLSSAPFEIRSEVLALVENDAELNKRVSFNTKILEKLLLTNLYRERLFPDVSEHDIVPYDICTFNVDDHFRLCCSVYNVFMQSQHPRNIHSMPESRMYNICELNKVKFRFEHPGYDVHNIRARMVSCHLSTHQFYLVASVYDIASVFYISGEDAFDLRVKAYIQSIPVLQNYEPDV